MDPRYAFAITILRTPRQRRHLLRWARSLGPDYLIRRGVPWLTFDAIRYLKNMNLKGRRVFEYGSGGSTLFWIRKGAKCVSVEHDPKWYRELSQRIGKHPALDYRLVPPKVANRKIDPSDPEGYGTSDETFRDYSFREYVCQIDQFADDTFDVVLIDGRARPSCIAHAARKVKPGGALVLDNADRTYYLERTTGYLSEYSAKVLAGVCPWCTWFTQTNIYVRDRQDAVRHQDALRMQGE